MLLPSEPPGQGWKMFSDYKTNMCSWSFFQQLLKAWEKSWNPTKLKQPHELVVFCPHIHISPYVHTFLTWQKWGHITVPVSAIDSSLFVAILGVPPLHSFWPFSTGLWSYVHILKHFCVSVFLFCQKGLLFYKPFCILLFSLTVWRHCLPSEMELTHSVWRLHHISWTIRPTV